MRADSNAEQNQRHDAVVARGPHFSICWRYAAVLPTAATIKRSFSEVSVYVNKR